jgi:hypothetical protein
MVRQINLRLTSHCPSLKQLQYYNITLPFTRLPIQVLQQTVFFHISPMHATCPAYLIILYLNTDSFLFSFFFLREELLTSNPRPKVVGACRLSGIAHTTYSQLPSLRSSCCVPTSCEFSETLLASKRR